MKIRDLCIVVAVLVVAAFAIQAITGTMVNAQSDSMVLSKLTEILKGQQAIAADIAAMRTELNVVKIRVTQLQ